MDNRALRLVGLSFVVAVAVAGCAGAPTAGTTGTADGAPPPPSTLELARIEVREAQAAGYAVDDALLFLRRADQAAAAGDEQAAAGAAEQARQAVKARQAIDGARPEVAKAIHDAGSLASDAEKLLEAAEAALKAGDPVRASELAAQARRQAAAAVEEKRAQAARQAAERARRYKVVRGDSLWTISGRPSVYGDPHQWPLLFRHNRDQVKDPDLIFPGQALSVLRDPSAADRKAAARHARTRGPWKSGVREESDSGYLGR